MDHGECKHEVYLSFEVIEAHTVSCASSCVDPVEQSGLPGTTLKFHQHLRLNIYGYDPSSATDETREFHREEAHPGARLNHRHSLGHERAENSRGVMYQTPERACQEIANPPRAHTMRHISPPTPTLHRKSHWISPSPNDFRFTHPE